LKDLKNILVYRGKDYNSLEFSYMISIKEYSQMMNLHIKNKILSLYADTGELFFGKPEFHISL
jgi:hypothetical protein